ncbi:MAG: alpha/beta hydrolase [Desulfobacteraceae bacterium]|nr:alpha/beta hydrolase [Desulfobacteraceae bacterium]MBC2754460.1 alpha/beta hydrolase [Desulfobacteraceae bacterium]
MEKEFKIGTYLFHKDPNFNYQMNRWVAFGGLPVDVVKKAAEKIKTLEDWCREFLKLAETAEAQKDILRAAFYYRCVDFFLPYDHPRKQDIYDRVVFLLRQYHANYFKERRIEENYVSYGSGRLPVWHAPSTHAGSKGTILFTGGFDCIKEELVPILIYYSDAGYDVYYFEGPGQGETLAKEGIPMTHEWEKPVSVVLDYFQLDDVTIIGLSLGGYLAPRAAIYDKRIRRIVSWGIMYDLFDVAVSRKGLFLEGLMRVLYLLNLPFLINAIVRLKMKTDPYIHWGIDHGMRVLGASSPAGYFRELKKYSLKKIAAKIQQDVLLTTGTEDHFVPLSHYYKLSKGLKNARSISGRIFTAHESSENHCQFGNIGLTLKVISNWIDFQSTASNRP